MNNVVEIRRKAKASDYEPCDFNGKAMYKLSWQERLLPGVICNSPEQGAAEYNNYIDDLPASNRERSNSETIIDCYEWCMSGELTDDKRTVAFALINAYHHQPIQGNFLGLTGEASEHIATIFFKRSEAKATLSKAQIELLEDRIK